MDVLRWWKLWPLNSVVPLVVLGLLGFWAALRAWLPIAIFMTFVSAYFCVATGHQLSVDNHNPIINCRYFHIRTPADREKWEELRAR